MTLNVALAVDESKTVEGETDAVRPDVPVRV